MNENCHARTDFLFSNSSFLIGAGSVFNLEGSYFDYNYTESPENADRIAICNDVKMVAKDLEEALAKFKGELAGAK